MLVAGNTGVMARTASVERAVETETTVSERVVSAVADVTGTDPVELEPLYTAVDSDALDALFEHSPAGVDRTPARLEFTYSGCTVEVIGDGRVRVSEAA